MQLKQCKNNILADESAVNAHSSLNRMKFKGLVIDEMLLLIHWVKQKSKK